MPDKRPSWLLIFQFFSNPSQDLARTPRLLILRKLTFFTNPSFHFLSLLVLYTQNFQCKIACFCICFSFILYDNLFLFFPSLYSYLKPFLNFRPPRLFSPCLLNFGTFSNPPFIGTPSYLELEISIFINSCMVVRKVVAPFFVNKFELYHAA